MSDSVSRHDEYLANPSGWSLDAVATLLPAVQKRGPLVMRKGRVHWKMRPEIPCPRCGELLQPGEVTLTFEHAPTQAKEQRARGFVCPCGEHYVPGQAARDAHQRAFAAWLAEPELRIPTLRDEASALLGQSTWQARYEAAVRLHECIRLESDRLRRLGTDGASEVAMSLERICLWACLAHDPVVANRAWERLTWAMEHGGLAEPSATLRPTFEALANDYAAALGQVPTGSKDRIEELAHRFPGAAQLWEEFATMLPPAEREDALIRAARLKGIVGIEDRDDAVADAVSPLTLGGAVLVSPRAA
jgi:hypothetical protein